MNKKAVALAVALALCGCTNWKAAYYQQHIELENCLHASPKVVTEIKEKTIVVNDTIPFIFELPADTVFIKQGIRFDERVELALSSDSSVIYLTAINQVNNGTLWQSIVIDSLRVKERVITNTKTIETVVVQNHYRVAIIIGLVVALVFIILFSFTRRR